MLSKTRVPDSFSMHAPVEGSFCFTRTSTSRIHAFNRFLGSDPEPRPGLSSGHIPHSLSLPFNMFLKTNKVHDSDKTYTTLLPPKDITAALETALGTDVAHEIISGARKVTTSCGSGMTAAILWLGLKTINDSIPVSLYDEVWHLTFIRDSVLIRMNSLGPVMLCGQKARYLSEKIEGSILNEFARQEPDHCSDDIDKAALYIKLICSTYHDHLSYN